MKNPLALLKNAVTYFLNNPVKSLFSLAVLFDGVEKANAFGQLPRDICHETVFTPTASGRSYTIETALNPCATLRAREESYNSCITKLNQNTHIHISSLSDIPRIDPKTNRLFQDTLGFSVCDQDINTGALVESKTALARKIWRGTENPHCPSMSFFKASGDAIELRETEPTELRRLVNDKDIRHTNSYDHCFGETMHDIEARGCKMEL